MKKVLIFQGNKTPTQSGSYRTKFWYLKFELPISYEEDYMTGWKGNSLSNNIKLKFPTLESAIAYANKKKYTYNILNNNDKKINVKSYADNFKFNRKKSDID